MNSDPIVVGVDGSPPSLTALRWAAAAARRQGVPLRVLLAYHWRLPGLRFASSAELEQAAQDQAELVVDEAVAVARAAGVAVSGAVDRAGDPAGRAASLRAWSGRFAAALGGAEVADPILPAVLHTIAAFRLDPADFARFLHSMAMDLTITEYQTYDDLLDYMEGSAAAIGTMMLPILGAADPAQAREPARHLGFAFQLTNFIRDVREDLALGRVYLPQKDLAEFGVTVNDLRAGSPTRPIRALISYEVTRARMHYVLAASGIPMLDRRSQPCIRAAFLLYGGILGEVVRNGYDVLSGRATVPNRRRLAVAAACLLTPPGRPVRIPDAWGKP